MATKISSILKKFHKFAWILSIDEIFVVECHRNIGIRKAIFSRNYGHLKNLM